MDEAKINCDGRLDEVREMLRNAFWGDNAVVVNWLGSLNTERSAFERTAITKDIEELQQFFEHQGKQDKRTAQMSLL